MAPTPLAYFSLIILLALCEGCKDDPIPEIEKLPPPTHSGARTLGCLINGKAYVVDGYYYLSSYYIEGALSISTSEKKSNPLRSLSIDLNEDDLQPGTYNLTEFPLSRGVVYDASKKCGYETSHEVHGTLTITYVDRSRYLLSGTFQFEAISPDCNEIVKVTDGRFDVVY